VLFALFFRPVGFDYRNKMPEANWRSAWDWGLFAGGFVPALVFGVAFGNLLLGVPFHFDDTLRSFYTGSFWQLLNPFALLCGLVSLSMLTMHGAVFLQFKTDGIVQNRAKKTVLYAGIACAALFSVAGIWLSMGVDGYRILSIGDLNQALNPLSKSVEVAPGAWLTNYQTYPWMMLAPVLGYIGIGMAIIAVAKSYERMAFLFSSIAIAGIILTAGFSLFPFLMPSSTDPNSSLLLWDSVSSKKTLGIMLIVTLIFLPLIITYTSWVFRVLRGKVNEKAIQDNTHTAY
jgi:cytochrome bd ubiquinol oxidase subunit II